MATIEIEGDELTIKMHGWDKLLALKSSMTLPLRDISNVTVRPPDARGEGQISAVRVAGGYIPGVLQTGHYWITSGLSGGTRALLASLEVAEKALAAWKHGAGGAKARATDHLREATREVREAVAAGNLVADDDAGWAFYNIHDADLTLGFDVANHRVRRVVVEVEGESPESAAARIMAALEGSKPYREPA